MDSIINKSRAHFYKPIQIAELLYRYRTTSEVDLDNPESYRNASKHWRDDMTLSLLGRKCSSTARFQDNLLEENAVPPRLIKILAIENKRNKGAVEVYIYKRFSEKYRQLSNALSICINATPGDFFVKAFIDSFWKEKGLKRSLDKVYEIIVYALFSTIVETLKMKVEVSVDASHADILSEFDDFAKMVMCIDARNLSYSQDAKVFRVGVTNAADRGLDMYSNWGPAIQIKHLCLDPELAESIVAGIASDRIVIVCKDAEKDVICSLLTQIGWKSRIQSVVTEKELIRWYEKALRGKYSSEMGYTLLGKMRCELKNEFPAVTGLSEMQAERGYTMIKNQDWN